MDVINPLVLNLSLDWLALPRYSTFFAVFCIVMSIISCQCYTAAVAGRLGSILSRVNPKTLKLVSAVTLAKRSAIKYHAEDEINRE